MAYSELLADRIRQELEGQRIAFSEKKMFGGLCFMVDEKMCVGIIKGQLMARVDPNFYATGLQLEGALPMDFTGKALKGYIFVDPEGVDLDEQLSFWVQKCLEYNPLAKASKKK